jgi:hypothetical protein
VAWRYIAQRLDGEGAGEFLDMALPLASPQVTDVLSGPARITGSIDPEVMRLKAHDGRPLLEEWSTAIYAEQDGAIRGGGILTSSNFAGSSWSLDVMGFAGYPQGMPFTGSEFFVKADPADIFRRIWEHLQEQPGGNLGVIVDDTRTAVRIGTELAQAQFDTQAGPVSFESGPYKLAWYQTDDLGKAMDGLAEQTPFEYREEHAWTPLGEIEHRLRIGYPSLGTRRRDLRFVVGENISTSPTLDRDGDAYVNEILALGAGEGRDMIRAIDVRRDSRLRRAGVAVDKTARTVKQARSLARRELLARNLLEGVTTQITVRDHPHARVGSWNVGDEIRVQGKLGWLEMDAWFRIVSSTLSPNDASIAGLSILRTESVMT